MGSLCSGIGLLDLGVERALAAAGLDPVVAWHVEIEEFPRRVLARRWPHATIERNVIDCGRWNLDCVDVLCAGFPCQDLSPAGRGAGLGGERSSLFFEVARVVRELRPRILVMENSAALLARGLGVVLGELASFGYDAEWDCLPASAFGAPHQRDRIFILAYPADADGDGVRLDEQRAARGRVDVRDSGEAVARDDGARRLAPDSDVQHVDVAVEGRRDLSDAARPRDGCVSDAACEGRPRQGPAHAHDCGAADPNGLRRSAGIEGATAIGERGGRPAPDVGARGRGRRIFDVRRRAWGEPPSPLRRVDDGGAAGVDGPRRRRPAADGPRLKALGNGVVVDVAEAVGARVAEIIRRNVMGVR